jgi:hypothetical protein
MCRAFEALSVDQVSMSRQQHLEPGKRPLLERLRQQREIGVGQCSLRKSDALIAAEVRIVERICSSRFLPAKLAIYA